MWDFCEIRSVDMCGAFGFFIQEVFSWILVLFLRATFPGYPTDMLRFLLGTHRLFTNALCNSPYRLRQAHAFAGGVFLSTEASQLSVGISEEAAL